jgi:uncharacterized membrane protein YhaH (DUF805 family)
MSLVVASTLLRDSDDAAGALACAGCGGFFFFIILLTFALQVALLVWVVRDAKARGMDAAVIWMIFVFLVPVVGLLVYVFARPQGTVVKCPHCHNPRLHTLAVCPYCGKV